MYEIAVCDDSKKDRERLIQRIKQCPNQKELRIHEFESGLELLEAMKDITFVAVFLDIQMQGLDGDETAKRIRLLDTNLVLVFYTGFAEPTPKRIEVQPFRYIMKNMSDYQIDEYIMAALNRVAELSGTPILTANLRKRPIYINPKHVIYIEKYKKSMRIQLAQSAYEIYDIQAERSGSYPDIRLIGSLESIYERLKSHGFGCPHDSYIINFSYLCTCTGKKLKLVGISDDFPIARSKAKEFNKLQERFTLAKYVKKE